MSKWKERIRQVSSYLDEESLLYIPMMVGHGRTEISWKLREEFDNIGAKNIIIIDPYFAPKDLSFVLHCFASRAERNIIIYTRLSSIDDNNKDLIKQQFKQIISELESKKVFNSITLHVPVVNFHDRYILSADEINRNILVSIGHSINNIGGSYSNIVKIKNQYFIKQVFAFIKEMERKCDGI
jgi:hypothetical protein